MKRMNLWATVLIIAITLISRTAFAGPIDWAIDKAVGGTKHLVTVFFLTLWGHGRAIFVHQFLPSEDNMVLGCIALALTLTWILGFEKTRNWAGRLSKISWGLVIILMVRSISSSMWENSEWWGKVILGALAIAGIAVILFAIIPAIWKAVSASVSSVLKLFESNPSTFSCVMGAILLAGIINGNQMMEATSGATSILSAFAGVGLLAWKGWEFYKKRQDGEEAKPKAKKELPETADAPAEPDTDVSEDTTDDEESTLAQCPACGEMSMGNSFCDQCGARHENAIVLRPKKKGGRGILDL